MHCANFRSLSLSFPLGVALLLGLPVEPLAEAMPLLPLSPPQPTNPAVNSRAAMIPTLVRMVFSLDTTGRSPAAPKSGADELFRGRFRNR